MTTSHVSPIVRWFLAGVLLLALLFGLAVPAGAQDDFGHATITLYAPGAPAGAWVSVQWQNRAGTWTNVAGWQGPLDMSTATTGTSSGTTTNSAAGDTADAADTMAATSDVAFKQWAVYPKDYGRGPFRWVVTAEQGGEVLATSNPFFLPDGDGAALAMILTSDSAVGAAGGPIDPQSVDFDFSTITLHAPDAPAGAPVGVQWQDARGNWQDVEGWQSTLDASADTGEPLKQWAVYPADYGQGPFRWIVYTEDRESVLATSPRFYLPNGDNAGLSMTVLPKIAVTPADTITQELAAAPATLPATSSTSGLFCTSGPCNAVISVSVPNAMAGSPVGVQWQDSFGLWHDVPSWQGTLSTAGDRSTPYQQWSISPELQGQGPFRWVVYNQLGDSVVGVTPGFMLPDRGGVNLKMTVPADFSDIAG